MILTSPLWLTALVPWAIVTIYLLLGRRQRAEVPFVELWRGPVQPVSAARSMQRLPMWIALLLLAAGSAILAAANPIFVRATRPGSQEMKVAAGIESLVVRHDQCMVTLYHAGPTAPADLVIEVDGVPIARSVALAGPGGSVPCFIDLPKGANRVRVALANAPTQQQIGITAEAVRRRTWPRVQAVSPLPDEVSRIVDVYTARRPASSESLSIAIARNDVGLLGNQPGIVLADATTAVSGKVALWAHPVTEQVDNSALNIQRVATAANSFTPIVAVDGRMIIGVRDSPARQVWMGFSANTFAQTPSFVVLWTNVLNWVGDGGDEFDVVPGTAFATAYTLRAVEPAMSRFDLSHWLAGLALVLSALSLAVAPRAVA